MFMNIQYELLMKWKPSHHGGCRRWRRMLK